MCANKKKSAGVSEGRPQQDGDGAPEEISAQHEGSAAPGLPKSLWDLVVPAPAPPAGQHRLLASLLVNTTRRLLPLPTASPILPA